MSTFDVEQLLERGFTMRFPAGPHERFSHKAATNMVGHETWVDAEEFGIHQRVKMRVVRAKVIDDGRALQAVLEPLPLR